MNERHAAGQRTLTRGRDLDNEESRSQARRSNEAVSTIHTSRIYWVLAPAISTTILISSPVSGVAVCPQL